MMRPELTAVKIFPFEEAEGLYGITCYYSDGGLYTEMWGTKEETERAAAIRREDIKVRT